MSENFSASVVIPAHDEGPVLGRCLDALLGGSRPGEFDVVVVANACTDDTAEVARRAGVRVVETPVAGKVHALNLGDGRCTAFPRVYLDADVEIDTPSLRELVAVLGRADLLGCSPRPSFDARDVGRVARRVHRVQQALMQDRRGLAGAGVYALSRAGHELTFPLPPVIADDGWVHRTIPPERRTVVESARSLVRPARTVRDEIRRRVRVRRANRQLDRLGCPRPDGALRPASLLAGLRSRSIGLVDTSCYVAVLAGDRVLTSLQRRTGEIAWSGPPRHRGTTPAVQTSRGSHPSELLGPLSSIFSRASRPNR